jgi:hypothetical protein
MCEAGIAVASMNLCSPLGGFAISPLMSSGGSLAKR